MTSSDPCVKVEQSARYGKSRFPLAALFLWTTAALASGPGPNGVNIGFDFNWTPGPLGYSASFIGTANGSGATLVNCTNGGGGGPVTPTSSACDFVFAYSIGGTPQTQVTPGGVYETYPTSPAPPTCELVQRTTAPLTLFNCFNTNSFGQVFLASATGLLSAFTMNLTCLNPAGTPPTGLFAVIYQVNSNGTLPATPLASTPVDLSTCPLLTSWSGHVFSAGDFGVIPMNFSNVTLTDGNFYAVFFSGLVPGAQLPGAPGIAAPTATPTLSAWGMIALAGLLVLLAIFKLPRVDKSATA